jgi:hypothetical protein
MQAYAGSASIGLQWISLIILRENNEKPISHYRPVSGIQKKTIKNALETMKNALEIS